MKGHTRSKYIHIPIHIFQCDLLHIIDNVFLEISILNNRTYYTGTLNIGILSRALIIPRPRPRTACGRDTVVVVLVS